MPRVVHAFCCSCWLQGLLFRAAGAVVLAGCAFNSLPAQASGSAAALVSFTGARGDTISAWHYPGAGAGASTAILVHGCGGPTTRDGKLRSNLSGWAGRFLERGWEVLILDSFGARGIRTICGNPSKPKALRAFERAQDIEGAIDWVYGRNPRARIVLVGFSHGSLSLLNGLGRLVLPRVRAAVAFYPPCRPFRRKAEGCSYSVSVPTLILTGEDDNWTPADECHRLSEVLASHGDPVELVSYPGAVHGFDFAEPVRGRSDILGSDGTPVKVGANRPALERSIQDVFGFLARILGR